MKAPDDKFERMESCKYYHYVHDFLDHCDYLDADFSCDAPDDCPLWNTCEKCKHWEPKRRKNPAENNKRLKAKQKACNFHEAKCCGNCKWRDDDYGEDTGYGIWCEHPDNEDKDAAPGEYAYFDVNDTSVCDRWESKEKCT